MPKTLTSTWKTSVFICASFLAIFIFANSAQAQGLGGVNFDTFDAIIDVNEEEATFTVTETITGEFYEYRHGIERYLPYRYENDDFTHITIRLKPISTRLNGEPEPFSTYKSGPYEVIQIGDPDITFDGPFEYEVVYEVERAFLYHDLKDEIYWNVTGDDWSDPFELITTSVRVDGVKENKFEVNCYTGEYGSVDQDCRVVSQAGQVDIESSDYLTVSVIFPKGVLFEPSNLVGSWWWIQDNWRLLFWLMPILSVFILIVVWFKYGRDSKGRGTIVAQYEPPRHSSENGKGDFFRPAEIGTVMDAKLHPLDMSATLIDLAVRGYMIIDEGDKKFLTGREYTLKRTEKTIKGLHDYEQEFLDAIFGKKKEVKIADHRIAISGAWPRIENMVYKGLARDGYFVKDPRTARGTFIVVGILLGIFGFIFDVSTDNIGDSVMWLAFVITGVIVAFFGKFMPKKTRQGTIAYEQAKGFHDFLKTALRYRVKWEEKEGIFEDYLPYAMIFGVAKKWANAVTQVQGEKSINTTWYNSSSGKALNLVSFTSSVESFASVSTASVSAPSSSGGGGGGGFSGGGFGGGGGGSW